ncbi:MAG: class II fumarate hydratase, partial [Bacteroidetes bacterium]
PTLKASKKTPEHSPRLVTAPNPQMGYDNSAKSAKKAHKGNKTLREATLELGLMSEEDFTKIVEPKKMTGPK